jgi:hypothetical protein
MKVRQKDVPDLEPEFLRVRKIPFDIALWIDNDRSRAEPVTQKVRGVRQTTQIVLLENQETLLKPLQQATLGER